MAKKQPTGFVATCQCGIVVGAMDYTRTDRKDAGQMIGKWLHEGCTVEPRFAGTWKVTVEACQCEPSNVEHDRRTAALSPGVPLDGWVGRHRAASTDFWKGHGHDRTSGIYEGTEHRRK